VLPYEPERWSDEQWHDAYDAGRLDFYANLDELGRYSLVVGYISWAGAEHFGRPPTVLDIGCGTGLLRRRLEGVPISGYLGVDLSDAAIRSAESERYRDARFLAGNALNLDVGRHDIVVLNELLYYLPDPVRYLRDAARTLRPDGLYVISMWRHPGDRVLWKQIASDCDVLDRVEVRNRGNRLNPRGWIVACCRPPIETRRVTAGS
jgi:SAM-dependent methyltransferase